MLLLGVIEPKGAVMLQFHRVCSVNVPCAPVLKRIVDAFTRYRRLPIGSDIIDFSIIYPVERFVYVVVG